MQVPILEGVYTDSTADFRVAYPLNMKPILSDTGISKGYLRPVEGIEALGTGPGVSRGAINWNGVHYRVMGAQLTRISSAGVVEELGSVGNDSKPVTLTYSFDRLAIASNEDLFYLDATDTLTQVTDEDLGDVLDVIWIDGYFLTTDGEYLVITELTDPTAVNPLKYGSSEVDPDPILAVKKLNNEVWAINRYTMEVFRNVGGSLFPFSRINGAQVYRGAFGTKCAIVFSERMAFLGSGREESPGVFLAANGRSDRISTREIDEVLSSYTETQLATCVLESRVDRSREMLLIRLPDRTLVYDAAASAAVSTPIWYVMSSSATATTTMYRGIDAIWCYDSWQVGDAQASAFGTLTEEVSSQFGSDVYWEFSTPIFYNQGRGAIIHSLELIALTGRGATGVTPTISTSYSLDGITWSTARSISVGTLGDRLQRIVWRRQGNMSKIRIQRFVGNSQAYLAVASLEAEVEALNR